MYDTGESLLSYTFWAGHSTLDQLLSYNILCHGSEDCQRHGYVGISKQASLRNKRNICQQTATHVQNPGARDTLSVSDVKGNYRR